jgi:translation initiation factor eIF-2B subunit epsilon
MSKNNNLQQQEKLIAVILLESYSEKFKPFSMKKAECLLPLYGKMTLLDNNIEYLIENSVEEIYLFCTNHHQQIKAHIDERKWKKRVEIHFLYNFKCLSVGDAMREIDAKNLISSTFILITASAFLTNIKLNEHLEQHKQLSKQDKNAVMTMLCQNRLTDLTYEFNQNDVTSLVNQSKTLIIHNNCNRILHYDKISTSSDKPARHLKLPAELFQNAYHPSKQCGNVPKVEKFQFCNKIGIQSAKNDVTTDSIQHLKQIQHRNDLVDTQIYLCSPYVLHMFTDNFDYESMSDFIRGVLVEEEVAGYAVYIDLINKKSGCHFSMINNLNSYYFETLNLIKRIDFLLNPTERANYSRVIDKCNSYASKKFKTLGKNLKIENNVLIDSNCMIGDNCELINCLIGANCKIGNDVKLSNCIIWPNTTIGSNTVINAALLGFNVKIGNNCSFCENCLFSNDCHVKDSTQLTKRGVYIPNKAHKDLSNCTDLSVHEDNYVKYMLNSDANVEDDDDDQFETDNETETHENYNNDAESVASADVQNESVNDTNKNNHFFVWKQSNAFKSLKNKLLRETDELGSGNNTDDNKSVYSDTSSVNSDYYQEDTDDDNNLTNEPKEIKSNLNKAVSTESLKSTRQNNEEDTEIFVNEATEILKRGFKENLNLENVILEINSCKHAHDIQIDDLCYYLVKVMFNLPLVLNRNEGNENFDYLTVIKAQIQRALGYLFKNYYTKKKQTQKIFLNALLDFFVELKPLNNVNLIDTVFVKLVHYLYNDEKAGFLSDEVILEWYDAKLNDSKTSPKHKSGLKNLEIFIKWLEEESDEEEDDDEDDDDE